VLPEIADYEVRRELIRAKKNKGIKRLDELKKVLRKNFCSARSKGFSLYFP